MSGWLLDVDVLIATIWPDHIAHAVAGRWFKENCGAGWATCAFTEAAFVRILSNPAFAAKPLTPRSAIELLERNRKHPTHAFWPMDVSLNDAVAPFRNKIVGHRQITDAYLLGLVLRRKGKLVTLDRALPELLAQDSEERNRVEVIKS